MVLNCTGVYFPFFTVLWPFCDISPLTRGHILLLLIYLLLIIFFYKKYFPNCNILALIFKSLRCPPPKLLTLIFNHLEVQSHIAQNPIFSIFLIENLFMMWRCIFLFVMETILTISYYTYIIPANTDILSGLEVTILIDSI